MSTPRIDSKRSLASSLLAFVNRCARPIGVEISPHPPPSSLDWHIKTILDYHAINCVLDVGANHGQFAARLRSLGYRGRIVSFEPIPAVFESLEHRFRHDAEWRGFQHALGEREEVRELNVADGDAQASSFLAFNDAGPERWGQDHTVRETVPVRIRRLDDVWAECVASIAGPRVFLKTDCQGFDVSVVKGAAECLQNVFAIQSELALEHYYHQMVDFTEAIDTYEDLGFDVVGFFPIARRKPDYLRVVEMDCLFMRSPA